MLSGLKKLASAVAEFLKGDALPFPVVADLQAQGYKLDIVTIPTAVCCSGMGIAAGGAYVHKRLLSPEGVEVNDPYTPPDVQGAFERAARAAYEKCDLPAPETIPGARYASSHYTPPAPQ